VLVLSGKASVNRKQRRASAKLGGLRTSRPEIATAPVKFDIDSLFARGVWHHEAGRLDDAEHLYRQILAVDLLHADSLHLLGVIAYQRGRPELAVELINKALAIKPDYPNALSNLGNVLQALDRPDEAIVHYKQALVLKPNHAEALSNLSKALNMRGRWDEAIACCEKALAIKPNYVDALFNLAVALQEQGKPDVAEVRYRRVLTLKPDFAEAYYNLALIYLRARGHIEKAQQYLESAIKCDPRNVLYYSTLGELKKYKVGDPSLAAMEELVKDPTSLSPQSQVEIHFALTKAYADVGEHERSFRQLLVGNALKRRKVIYDEDASLKLFDRITNVFTKELIDYKKGLGDPSSIPVFIVGMPRSGTTLVEQILASHPKVFGAGELDDFARAGTAIPMPLSPGTPTEFPEALSTMGAAELRNIGTAYVDMIRSRSSSAERITNKLPMNFKYVGLIHLALPNARIIHVQRNSLDTCLSCFSKLFVEGMTFTYELSELGRYFTAYTNLMDHWRKVLPPGAMLEVQYEDIIADIEQQARRIIDYCGLEWEPSCLSFYKTERPVRTASAAQVRRPIYGTSIGRWRLYKHLLRPLLDALDIDPSKD
jgi:tetratricopeptide (TPR) repeat protein